MCEIFQSDTRDAVISSEFLERGFERDYDGDGSRLFAGCVNTDITNDRSGAVDGFKLGSTVSGVSMTNQSAYLLESDVLPISRLHEILLPIN